MYNSLFSSPVADGGGDDPTPKQYQRLTPAEMEQWNAFLDFLKQKGVAGSKDLDKRDQNMGQQYFSEFKKSNPNIAIDYSPEFIGRVQNEHNEYAKYQRDFAKRHGNPDADKLYKNNSQVDEWMGSLTSQQRFVPVTVVDKVGGQVIRKSSAGLMNASGAAVSSAGGAMSGLLPKGVKPENIGGQWYYPDPNDPSNMIPIK